MAWLPDGEKISKISLFILTQLTNVTDGQTHTQTLHADRPRLCIASSGKKTKAKGRATSARSKKQCVSSVFSRLLNVGSDHDGDEVTSAGRLFHTRAAATGNARSPTVDSRVTGTTSVFFDGR